MKDLALNYYLKQKLSCAQAVASAWAEKHPEDKGIIATVENSGHGTADGGTCGALYAACVIGGESNKEKIENEFKCASGGYTACRDIRVNKTLRCTECVCTAADILEKHLE